MEKKHMVPEPGREEMEGARRATGISSLSEPCRPSGASCRSRSGSSGEGRSKEIYGGLQASDSQGSRSV